MSRPPSTTRQLTGYSLESQFRKLRTRWQFTPLEHYVFSELIALCNEAGWPAEFSATNSLLIGGVGCSEKGLISARKRLVESGLISFVEGRNRRPTSYHFCCSEHLPEVSLPLEEHLPKGLPQVSVSEFETSKYLPEGLPKDLPEVSPYKEQTKTKDLLRKPSLRKAASSENASSFDTFWLAYDKKRDRFKCEKKWSALLPDEQAAALAHAPRYVLATPERQYRKDPLTYLNGKCWLDEDMPAPRHIQPVLQPPPPASPTPAPGVNHEFVAQQEAAQQAARAARFAKYTPPTSESPNAPST
jgi:hypothetical protein